MRELLRRVEMELVRILEPSARQTDAGGQEGGLGYRSAGHRRTVHEQLQIATVSVTPSLRAHPPRPAAPLSALQTD